MSLDNYGRFLSPKEIIVYFCVYFKMLFYHLGFSRMCVFKFLEHLDHKNLNYFYC